MTEPTPPPRVEVTVAAPVEDVWAALRDPGLLRRWHGWHYDGLDDEIRQIYLTDVTEDAGARVLRLGDGDRFSLHGTEGGTVVRLTRGPIGANPDWDAYYDDITQGWRVFLWQLRFAVERHGLAPRRTLHLEGSLDVPGSPAEALGLGEAAALPPGSPYKAESAAGGTLSGEVWASGPDGLLITVDRFGDGLAVLAPQPRTAYRPDGGTLVVLTAYDMDDAAFAAVEERWTSWWDAHRRPEPARG
ncbi:hypothetical protein Ssi03_73220 [Sphaerisporangium siamense]|uniref:SRPBCC domain-containing protein n=1 Tax=Sphaerisporangium siamense TaxID=795645 RepID=A0A7W7DA99_9ACTN|nr:hypothetical protein [Sphaerisporangium siamense]MBB4703142.1 hypothetical protein [Sphaerisporangium siamense]GII89332.1 hypothetical protein Ssi03_73220 [Sphaerisporangium siamense]